MTTVILVIHLLIAIALVGVVLLQKSEGGALGMGGGGGGSGGGMGGFLSGREKANLLTRTTAILAALFMTTSITLAILGGAGSERGSILDAPATATEPAVPAKPAAPLAN